MLLPGIPPEDNGGTVAITGKMEGPVSTGADVVEPYAAESGVADDVGETTGGRTGVARKLMKASSGRMSCLPARRLQ